MPDDGADIDRLSRLEAVVESLAEGQRKQGLTLEAIQTAVNAQGRVSWPLIVSIVGMVGGASLGTLTLALSVGAMALAPIRENIHENRDALAHLDTTLQREMRLLDDAMKGEITHLSEGREENRRWLLDLDRRITRIEGKP